MTHAAVECAAILRSLVTNDSAQVVALCGPGNNGGDGYAIVRTLHSWGVRAHAIEVAPPRSASDAAVMHRAAASLGLVAPTSARAGLCAAPFVLVDAIFGTGLTTPAEGCELEAIQWINSHRASAASVVSIDVPSGLDCDTGLPLGGADDAVRATHTLTMVCEKQGFSAANSAGYLGKVTVVSIGGPPPARQNGAME